MSKTRASCFIRDSRHLETIKALGLRPRTFICFSVSGTPDETLALVFDILLKAVLYGCYKQDLVTSYIPDDPRSFKSICSTCNPSHNLGRNITCCFYIFLVICVLDPRAVIGGRCCGVPACSPVNIC